MKRIAVKIKEAPFLNVLVLYGHCPNSFRPLPSVKRANVGKKCHKPSWQAFTPPLPYGQYPYARNTFQKGASLRPSAQLEVGRLSGWIRTRWLWGNSNRTSGRVVVKLSPPGIWGKDSAPAFWPVAPGRIPNWQESGCPGSSGLGNQTSGTFSTCI